MNIKKIIAISAIVLLPAVFAYGQRGEVAAQPSKTFINPLWKGADPWIMKHDGMYYTCKSAGGGVEISQSRFLTRKEETRVVWRTPQDGWNRSFVWAPELHNIDGKWYIYYAAGLNTAKPFIWQRTGVLMCDTPLGDYQDMGQLYTGDDPEQKYENIWAIDMTVFKYRDKLYAVWSGWEHNSYTDATQQNLYIAHMPTPTSIGKRVLLTVPTEPWEKGEHFALVEGPSAIQHDGNLFIMYSTRGSWTIHYKIGQLRLKSADSDPLDPQSWVKSGPVFMGDPPHVLGVGHASFTTSPDDKEWWIYYHTKVDTIPGWNRAVCLQKFDFDADGNPRFGMPLMPDTPIARPSGEYEREVADAAAEKKTQKRR